MKEAYSLKVVVLMSTYNGEKYIREQLDSILNQTIANQVQIYIRDDGSGDSTISIIEEYIAAGADIILDKAENIGVIASFFELITTAPEADYYSFADQDDVWLEKKLEVAVEKLSCQEQRCGKDMPILYCGDTNLVDGELNLIKRESKNPRPSFGNALVENICTGCTAVINRALLEKIRDNIPDTSKIIMHDWWLYLIAEAYGMTIYDNEPHMYYRQHGNNEWGAKTSRWAVAKHRLKQLFAKRGQIYRQIEDFQKCMRMSDQNRLTTNYGAQIQLVLDSEKSFLGKCRLIKKKDIYRNDNSRDRVYRWSVLIGKL